MSPAAPPVSVVAVHYRGDEALGRCVRSCLAIDRVAEVVVVDNQGVAGHLRRAYPERRVRVVGMARNVGYGGAANVGLGLARSDRVVVLNQDAMLTAAALETMEKAGAASGAWVVGPVLVAPNGMRSPAKDRFPPPLPWAAPAGKGDGWRHVPWVSGAAMLLMPGHTDLRFDERLFMYVEDEELCWRVWVAGGTVVLAEEAPVRHDGGTATGQRWGRWGITARTTARRARMVRWHAGWRALPAFTTGTILRALGRRLR